MLCYGSQEVETIRNKFVTVSDIIDLNDFVFISVIGAL